MLGAFGAAMGLIGPYATSAMPATSRIPYWLLCIAGGGAVGVAVDAWLSRRMANSWRRVALTSLLITVPAALLVVALSEVFEPARLRPTLSPRFLGQVLVVAVLVMGVRALARRTPATVVRTRIVVAPPLPEAEAAFRRRLSSKRRTARLIAVQAEDHYLRVHTDAGAELLTMRFADALEALAGAAGFQTHRSWWIAGDAIEGIRWRRGAGDAHLAGGLVAPVSRAHAAVLKSAGWR
ncbi:LytTR family DNA-binding domain-containing protein [Phenylobacterium sp.]|uniref:LytTR family DNA-binding domain-containing protein n=1 Tax=Phenylobacterium sp. TaxID=1871053 RepID=UPI002BA5E8A7|nr:LytTR family DNA-binding domain-containing protein [Phenylobacterium sp.]HLZ75997.1 LytTR family DNA-binding domain-containing protein [Phenylobacterium sp.]